MADAVWVFEELDSDHLSVFIPGEESQVSRTITEFGI